jgi:hypothetical protein
MSSAMLLAVCIAIAWARRDDRAVFQSRTGGAR